MSTCKEGHQEPKNKENLVLIGFFDSPIYIVISTFLHVLLVFNYLPKYLALLWVFDHCIGQPFQGICKNQHLMMNIYQLHSFYVL